jgi:threonylcarbamoyladenosine tRNA methylthiotransferase MtaB
VLFEAEEDKGKMSGFTQNYIKVETDYDPLLVNELISAELLEITLNGNVSAAIQQMVH